MDFESVRKSISEKIGEENSALISDDFATMMTIEKSFNDSLEAVTKERDSLKDRNEKLINANANLLLKVGNEVSKSKEEEIEEEKPFNFSSVFDEKGNFKK